MLGCGLRLHSQGRELSGRGDRACAAGLQLLLDGECLPCACSQPVCISFKYSQHPHLGRKALVTNVLTDQLWVDRRVSLRRVCRPRLLADRLWPSCLPSPRNRRSGGK